MTEKTPRQLSNDVKAKTRNSVPPTDADAKLAKAISELADMAAESIESNERQNQANLKFQKHMGLLTAAALAAYIVVAWWHTTRVSDGSEKIQAWVDKAEQRDKRAEEMNQKASDRMFKAEQHIDALQKRLDESVKVNMNLATSISAFIESETSSDKYVSRKALRAAQSAAILAEGTAVKSEIDQAKRERKAIPPPLAKQYQEVQTKARAKGLDLY
jgi:uncharacterized membrane protein YheB (UPF0754 family)